MCYRHTMGFCYTFLLVVLCSIPSYLSAETIWKTISYECYEDGSLNVKGVPTDYGLHVLNKGDCDVTLSGIDEYTIPANCLYYVSSATKWWERFSTTHHHTDSGGYYYRTSGYYDRYTDGYPHRTTTDYYPWLPRTSNNYYYYQGKTSTNNPYKPDWYYPQNTTPYPYRTSHYYPHGTTGYHPYRTTDYYYHYRTSHYYPHGTTGYHPYRTTDYYYPYRTSHYYPHGTTGYYPYRTTGYYPYKTTDYYHSYHTSRYHPHGTTGYHPYYTTGYRPYRTTDYYYPYRTSNYYPHGTTGYFPYWTTRYHPHRTTYDYYQFHSSRYHPHGTTGYHPYQTTGYYPYRTTDYYFPYRTSNYYGTTRYNYYETSWYHGKTHKHPYWYTTTASSQGSFVGKVDIILSHGTHGYIVGGKEHYAYTLVCDSEHTVGKMFRVSAIMYVRDNIPQPFPTSHYKRKQVRYFSPYVRPSMTIHNEYGHTVYGSVRIGQLVYIDITLHGAPSSYGLIPTKCSAMQGDTNSILLWDISQHHKCVLEPYLLGEFKRNFDVTRAPLYAFHFHSGGPGRIVIQCSVKVCVHKRDCNLDICSSSFVMNDETQHGDKQTKNEHSEHHDLQFDFKVVNDETPTFTDTKPSSSGVPAINKMLVAVLLAMKYYVP